MVKDEPKWNPNRPQIPIDKNGNWLSYPAYGQDGWVTIQAPFWASLEVDGMTTGRSSKLVWLKDSDTGRKYPMFVGDLVNGIKNGTFDVISGRLHGWWTGSKRGANYGIKAVNIRELTPKP